MHTTKHDSKLFLIKRPAEIEIQLQHTPVERTPKPSSVSIFPRMPYDPERDIFIWRTGREYDQLGIVVSWYSLESIYRSF